MKRFVLGFVGAMVVMFSGMEVFAANDITFQVNMKIKLRENVFAKTDTLVVRGGFQGWGGTANKLTDPDGDSIYTAMYNVGTGTSIEFKYVMVTADGDLWESTNNRTLTLTGNAQTLPVVYFEDDTVFSGVTKTGNILFTVDMSPYITLGWFLKDRDTLYVRGAFNGWSIDKKENSLMQSVPGTNFYTLNLPTKGIQGSEMLYKFFVWFDLDTVRNPSRKSWHDWYGWELPTTVGGGNRGITYEGTSNQEVPPKYFNDVHPDRVVPSGKTIALTFNIDMRPAFKAATNPFHKTDTLWFTTDWENWAVSQGRQPGKQADLRYSDPDGDSIYTLTFNVSGPVPGVVEYHTEYSGNSAEGGGFDFGRFRTRYIKKDGTSWPTAYTFPTDVYTQSPPLEVEKSPEITGVKRIDRIVPEEFSVAQNFPNPFNPTTKITYAIPGDNFVSVSVFNILGQEVATLVKEKQSAGRYEVTFDASKLSSGVYMYRVEAGSFTATKKMLLLK